MWTAVIVAERSKFMAENAVVEANVVRNKNTTFGEFNDFFGKLIKLRRRCNHAIINSSKANDKFRDFHFRIYQTGKFTDNVGAVVFVNRDFSDFGCFWASSSCLNINDYVIHLHM